MKRAAGRIVGAAALELHMAINDLDDVDPAEQILDERLRNHADANKLHCETNGPLRTADISEL